jgi:hypothetical protein
MKTVIFEHIYSGNKVFLKEKEIKYISFIMNVVATLITIGFTACLVAYIICFVIFYLNPTFLLGFSLFIAQLCFLYLLNREDDTMKKMLSRKDNNLEIFFVISFAQFLVIIAVFMSGFYNILNNKNIIEKVVVIEGKKHIYRVTYAGEERMTDLNNRLSREDMLPATYKSQGLGMSEFFYKGISYDVEKIIEKYGTFKNYKLSLKIKNI